MQSLAFLGTSTADGVLRALLQLCVAW